MKLLEIFTNDSPGNVSSVIVICLLMAFAMTTRLKVALKIDLDF